MVAGNGNDADGERVVRMLSGERALDVPSSTHTGALRLITTSAEQSEQYVDLIHETLIRARTKDEKTGKLVGYWPTLYDYIDKNRDRDIHRQQLKFQTERWLQSKGLGPAVESRVFGLRALPGAAHPHEHARRPIPVLEPMGAARADAVAGACWSASSESPTTGPGSTTCRWTPW